MEKLIITGGKFILPEGIVEGVSAVCDVKTGKILEIKANGEVEPDSSDVVIDAAGRYVSPGFVDIHVHGGGGFDIMDGNVESFLGMSEMHATHGTTSMLPTTLTCTDEELFRVLDVFEKACSLNQKGAQMLGLHLEGPFFSAQRSGAQDPSYLKNPVPENYMKFLEASDKIMRWSVAPELEGAMDFADELSRRGILPSIAHSDAVYEVAEEAYRHGCSHVTHLYCAMSSIVRKNAFRYAGIQEAAYLIDDMTVEIIADGVHLPAPLLQFVYRFKGPDKIALVTDSMRGAGMPDGLSVLGSRKNGQQVLIEDGVAKLMDRSAFAGSVATTDRLVRNMIRLGGASLPDAVKMATETPARIMGFADRGRLQAGLRADLVFFDDEIRVSRTMVAGRTVFAQ